MNRNAPNLSTAPFATCQLAFLIVSLLAAHASAVTTYYSVDFSAPTHTAGSAPTYSASTDTPSDSRAGSARIVPSHGPINNQAMLLNTAGNSGAFLYEQVWFELARSQSTYHVSFDVYTAGLIGSPNLFNVTMSFPSVSHFTLMNDGRISPGMVPAGGGSPIFRTYQDRALYHVDISFDIPINRRVVLIDGQMVSDGDILSSIAPGDPVGIQFSLGLVGSLSIPDHATEVVVDNVVISNGFVIPEPASGVWLLLAGLLAAGGRRRA